MSSFETWAWLFESRLTLTWDWPARFPFVLFKSKWSFESNQRQNVEQQKKFSNPYRFGCKTKFKIDTFPGLA